MRQYAGGWLCHYHFEQREPRPLQVECDNCWGCLAAQHAESVRIQREHTIDPEQPYGQHIALRCVDHPELRWTTKNIDRIGARSIFFVPGSGDEECACSAALLEVVKL